MNLGGVFRRHSDLLVAGLVVSIIGMMIVPLPTFLLDLLLSLNITLAVILLMVSIYVTDALRIASFPTILLITTMFRLGLNVSTTRLILRDANAGEVVRAFGEFVVAGNVVVGAVIFLILTLIQFIVIAKGSERVAEVAARFTLDAMPGKQMSIDADLRSGHIDQDTARQRRTQLQRESQLYGSMDGAMKFVKGDAIAGILITVINIVGGLIIGVGMRDMSAGEAGSVYTILTVGDGLVSQIPALIISLAAGMIVTRVASEDEGADIGHDIVTQILAQPKAIAVASVLLAALGIVPGLPTVPFLLLAAGTGALAYSLKTSLAEEAAQGESAGELARGEARAGSPQPAGARNKGTKDELAATGVLPIALDLCTDAVEAIDAAASTGEFIGKIVPGIRRALYRDLGVILPGVRVRRSSRLPPGGYAIMLNELPMREGVLALDRYLVDAGADRLEVLGLEVGTGKHPISGRDIASVPAESAPIVEQAGLSAWSPSQVLAMTIAGVLRRYAYEFIGIQEAQHLLDELEKTHPALVGEVVPKVASPQLVGEVLRRLVEEQVSIRDLRTVLQALAEWAPNEKDTVILTEYVRSALRRQITHEHAHGNTLPVYLLDSIIEDTIAGAIQKTQNGSFLALPPDISRDIMLALNRELGKRGPDAPPPIILTTMEVRRYVRRLLEINHPDITVLSYQELASDVNIQPLARVSV